jgi:hypothetical protein
VRAQHASLYAQGSGLLRTLRALLPQPRGGRATGITRDGMLGGAGDLLELLNYGLRGGRHQ